jgi:hypothetical protein
LNFPNINHYWAERFYFLIGRDARYPFWNGQVASLNVNLGAGAFKAGDNYKDSV